MNFRLGARFVAAAVLSLLIPSTGFQATNAAAIVVGNTCAKVNATESLKGTKYICLKFGKKLSWIKVPVTPRVKTSTKPAGKPSSKLTPSPAATKPNAKPSATPTPSPSSTKGSDKKSAAFTTKIGSGLEITVGNISDPFKNLAGALILDGVSTTPTVCSFVGAKLALLKTGKCSVTFPASNGPSTATAEDLKFSFIIGKPTLKPADEQMDAAKNVILVPVGQTLTTASFEFTVLSLTDNVGGAVCADDPDSNEGCTKDGAGAGIVDPKAGSRYVKMHLKMKNLGSDILTPGADFKILFGHEVYDVSAVVTLEILNGQDISPGASLEGDYYFYIPKMLALPGGLIMADNTFTNPDEVVLFAY